MEQFREVAAIGSAEFLERVKRASGEGDRETERRSRIRARVTFEDVVSAVARARDADRSKWLGKHGDWGKWLVLQLARRYTGMSLSELGAQLGGKDYAAVSMGLRRFDKTLKAQRAIKKIRAAACRMLNV